MNPLERRAVSTLAGVYALRMLGLFLILPVFSLFAQHLPDATPLGIGLAIGAYGLTQALLQIPFGMWSDRIGRKPVIVTGLVIFALGSVIAALSDTLAGIIVGRTLQGAGAIAAAVMALVADVTRETERTKAMAVLGVSIGGAFVLALVAGPMLDQWIGVRGIFWLTAAFAVVSIGLVGWFVPEPAAAARHTGETDAGALARVWRDPQLLRLDFGIFSLQAIMTATFVALPIVLHDFVGLETARHWHLYLPVLLASVVLMVPFIVLAGRMNGQRWLLLGSIGVLGLAELALGTDRHGVYWIAGVLVVYFTAFNVLEASLPSLVSRLAPAHGKGAAMGLYSTAQFFGAFVGGLGGGAALGAGGVQGAFWLCAALALVWLGVMIGLVEPAPAAAG